MGERHMEENAQYVMENRTANENERKCCEKALEIFGWKDADLYEFHLYGNQDEPYGFYLFGITRKDGECFDDGQDEKYLMLGDCLDVLPDYEKVLTLAEVHDALVAEDSDGRCEAAQKWGVYRSISIDLYNVLADMEVSVENERVFRDAKESEWKLSLDVAFATDMGGYEVITITIPAQLGSREDADREFFSEWKVKCAAYKVDERYKDYMDDNELTAEDAMKYAEGKGRALARIRRAISNYLDEGITPDEDEALAESRERVEGKKVWVLTIYKDEQFFPEVHKTLDGAIEGALNDIMEHMDEDEVDDYDHEKINNELASCHYWHDDIKDVVYDIAECVVVK